MNKCMVLISTPALLLALLQLPAESKDYTILTFADGRTDGGIRQGANIEDGFDFPGDVFVFDQKLISGDTKTKFGDLAPKNTDQPQPLMKVNGCGWSVLNIFIIIFSE